MRALVRLLVPLAALAAGIAAVAMLGCNNSSKPVGPSSVRGRVTFQGHPVAGATVVFSPDRDRGTTGKPLRADTGADGVFELHFENTASIPPGWYRVAIAPPPGEQYAGSNGSRFPPQLRRPDTSTLVREVAPGKEHVFEFAVEVPPSSTN